MSINSHIKVSVITVCFNAADVLHTTIDSVLKQTYQHIEYIIVDGASNDGTIEVVRSFEYRVHKFISEPDKGLYDAMNKGVKAATGELVIFLNAGDYFVSKDVLDFMISKMNHKDADLFFGRIVWNDPKTKEIVLSDHSWCNFTWDLQISNFPHPATFYKKELFDDIGFFDLRYTIAADYEWNVRALVAAKIRFQYIDLIVSVFFADGISNDLTLASKHQLEKNLIKSIYFKPTFFHEILANKRKLLFRSIIEKIVSKVFKCRLSRTY